MSRSQVVKFDVLNDAVLSKKKYSNDFGNGKIIWPEDQVR